ncbi:hypothetical protein NOCARDAX2BIS_460049 [Nocardioides sp. AX2bis]|nr:hypothetical protein NOCARDAX2BIS_460049 [Nocardioides sp. AX2bis]
MNRIEFRVRLWAELGECKPDDNTVVLDDDPRVLLGQAGEARPPHRRLLLGRHSGEGIGRPSPAYASCRLRECTQQI